jgi:hypothetical protein
MQTCNSNINFTLHSQSILQNVLHQNFYKMQLCKLYGFQVIARQFPLILFSEINVLRVEEQLIIMCHNQCEI